MDNSNEQKIVNNKQDEKLVIKFQIQKNIKKQKCKSRPGIIYKIYSPKSFTIRRMQDKNFHSGVALEVPEGIQAYVVTLLTFSVTMFKP